MTFDAAIDAAVTALTDLGLLPFIVAGAVVALAINVFKKSRR